MAENIFAPLGMGGIYSNVNDMYLWDQAIDKSQLVSNKTFNEAMKLGIIVEHWQFLNKFWCYDSTTNWPAKFSCGWYSTTNNGLDALWAEGGSIGFSNMYVKIPEKNLSVIILTNLKGNWSVIKESNLLVQAARKLPEKNLKFLILRSLIFFRGYLG